MVINPTPATQADIQSVWQHWGLPLVTMRGVYWPEDVEGVVLKADGKLIGLITWAHSGEWAEIVSIDAFERGKGYGRLLLTAAENELAQHGVTQLSVITSNDNLPAVGFYQKLGFRLRRVHLDAMDRVREHKPHIPATGLGGLPLIDMWELEKPIGY